MTIFSLSWFVATVVLGAAIYLVGYWMGYRYGEYSGRMKEKIESLESLHNAVIGGEEERKV